MDPNALLAEQATAQAFGSAGGANRPSQTSDRERAREVAVEFEANFLAQMLRHMYEDVDTGGLFGGGNAESVNRSLLMEEYGKTLAQNGGIGLADQVMDELLKVQEAQQ
ncbi:MAG: chemotactic signal-response protein chel [Gammaproteobacteria bacterium]|nr:chemotactic signal-response protein chel [Gammaproteobacteria bacterium]